jgi:hypothetical protein
MFQTKRLISLTLCFILIFPFGFIKLSAQQITFYKKDHWKGTEILPTHAAITVDLTNNIVTINGERNYFNNWRSYPVNSINIPGFGKLMWHIPKRNAIIQRLYGGSEYFWTYTEEDVKIKNTKFFKDIRAVRKKASDAYWAKQKEKDNALPEIDILLAQGNPDSAAIIYKKYFPESRQNRITHNRRIAIQKSLSDKYGNTDHIELSKSQQSELFKHLTKQLKNRIPNNAYPKDSLLTLPNTITVLVENDSFIIPKAYWDNNLNRMIDLKGKTSVSVNTKKYDFNIRQIGISEFYYHTDTLIDFSWDSLKIAVSKKTFKKINQQKWMIAYNAQDKIIKVMDYKPKYAETGWHQPIVYPKKDNILFIDSWQNKFVSDDTFIIGGKVEQTVNIRISLDKSRNTEKDILLNQSKIDPYAFSYKRSVLKSTSTWAQRNPGVFVLLGMPLTLAVLFFAIE